MPRKNEERTPAKQIAKEAKRESLRSRERYPAAFELPEKAPSIQRRKKQIFFGKILPISKSSSSPVVRIKSEYINREIPNFETGRTAAVEMVVFNNQQINEYFNHDDLIHHNMTNQLWLKIPIAAFKK